MMPQGARLPSLKQRGRHARRPQGDEECSGGVNYEFRDAIVSLNGRIGSVEMIPSVTTSDRAR